MVIVTVGGIFVSLGNWQLRRHEERVIENTVHRARLATEPLDLETMLASAGDDLASLEFRPTRATGTFRPADEILVRSQVADGRPGFHVVTPFDTEFGTILVNRGWVPLAAERPPVLEVTPPGGEVTVSGVLRLSQVRPSVGPTEPDGRLALVARIDLDRLGDQFDDLVPVWIQQTDPVDGSLPELVPLPAVDDPGPHLPYAVQWYSFAAVALGGFVLLLRRAARGGG